MWFFKKKDPALASGENESHEALRSLALRLHLNAGQQSLGIIAFIAARAGEGTTTLALKYATLLCNESNKKVLLIDGSPTISKYYEGIGLSGNAGIIDAALSDQTLEGVLCEIIPGLFAARWVAKRENRAVADRIMQNAEFWKRLQTEFGCIIVDSPSLQTSFDGVALASKADATVMVVEAESTPTPVTQKLRDTLLDAGAKIVGVVLTKRRYYIPQGVYNKL